MKHTKYSRTIVSPFFLFACTLVTTCIIAYILYTLSALAFNEKPIALLADNDPQIVALAKHEHPIEVGLFVDSFDKFDITNDEFIFSGVLSFKFHADEITLADLAKITFARGEILSQSDATVHMDGELTHAQYFVRAKISSNLDYAWYPFEDHRISLIVVDRMPTEKRMLFTTTTNNFTAPDMGYKGWHKFDTQAQAGYLEEPAKNEILYYPAAVFSIDYGRHTNIRNIFLILLPMLLLFFIAVFSLILNPATSFTFVLGIPVTTIAALISFRFVVESISPKVGYFMYSDYFFVLFLSLVFTILIVHTFGTTLNAFVRKLLIITFDLILILFIFYLVYHIDTAFKARFLL